MTSRVLLAAVTVLAVGTIAGCSNTVTGSVAMTTEPGFSNPTRSSPSRTPGSRAPRTPSTAPGDAQSVTCGEFLELPPESQASVAQEIFGYPGMEDTEFGTDQVVEVVTGMCSILSGDIKLSEMFPGTGSPP